MDLDELIERKALRGDPDKEARLWLDKLAEADRKRSGFQYMVAEGLITFDELRAKLAALEETQETAWRELEALSQRQEEIEALEHDRDAMLASYTRMVGGLRQAHLRAAPPHLQDALVADSPTPRREAGGELGVRPGLEC